MRFVILVLLLTTAVLIRPTHGAPTYQLREGEVSTYELRAVDSSGFGTEVMSRTLDLYCLKKYPDGQFRMLGVENSAARWGMNPVDLLTSYPATLHWFLMKEDGMTSVSEAWQREEMEPCWPVLPVLPSGNMGETTATKGTWVEFATPKRKLPFRVQPFLPLGTRTFYYVDSTLLEIYAAIRNPMNLSDIEGEQSSWAFNAQEGRVETIRYFHWDLEAPRHAFTEGEFARRRQIGPEEVKSLLSGGALFARTQQAYSDSMVTLSETQDTSSVLRSAAHVLQDALKTSDLHPLIEAQLKRRLELHENYAPQGAEQDQKLFALRGRRGPEWEAADEDGTTHTLSQYRGKVVLLDFWFKNCGWCVVAMPALEELQRRCGAGLQVVGISRSDPPEDIRKVREKTGVGYPLLQGQEVCPKYHIRNWPTLVIIDRQGMVRHVEFGYSGETLERLTRQVKELL